MSATETLQFQAEARQVLDLMIHSLYTNKEIFLRELISNASDALDRLRIESLTQENLLGRDDKFEIQIEADAEARTLTIHDSGIGMSREEAIRNLGTIARSGTREVLAEIQGKSHDLAERLIGQFGVGFYSAFMVADRVSVLTRRAGESRATLWESSGDGTYTVADAEKFRRGTSITLHLKPVDEEGGIEDYTQDWVIRRIVKQYSDFVTYPITFRAVGPKAGTKAQADPQPINSMRPIWARPASEVTEEEYREFYRHVSHDWNEPLRHFSFKAEGRIEYQALLYLPSQAPPDLFFDTGRFGLHLYVRRVLIMEHCEDLLPRYLRFVKGVVDSSDLPLNISRQRLQEDRHVLQMRKWLTRKLIDALGEMAAKETETYLAFWRQFGRVLKEGAAFDSENKDRLVALLRFGSTREAGALTTLADYVGRMPPDQQEIFYLTGAGETIARSPHLEAFAARGVEVLLLTDPIDELLVQALDEFEGRKLESAAKGTVKLGSDAEQNEVRRALNARQVEYVDLLSGLKERLADQVKEVRLTNRLTESPACLVVSEQDPSPQFERLLRLQRGESGRQLRILELNPDHAIVRGLLARIRADKTDPVIDDYAHLLVGGALLAEGSEPADAARFNQALARLMSENLKAPPPAEAPSESGRSGAA